MRKVASLIGIGGLVGLLLAGFGGGRQASGVTGSGVNGVLTGALTGQAPTPDVLTGKIAFASERTGGGDIYVMNADGTDVTRLTRGSGGENDPAWSPDGSKIAFTSLRFNNSDICVMNADGTDVTRLTQYSDFEWQAARIRGDYDAMQRVSLSVGDSTPTWSPDGSKIAFMTDRTGNPRICLIDADGTRRTTVLRQSAGDFSPAWSPDGSKIAFASNCTGNADIYVMNVAGRGLTRLTRNPADDLEPAWSPDGSKIAFVNEGTATRDVYMMNAAGRGLTRLTHDGASENPAWSPDGSKIAFDSKRGGDRDIYVMNADGGGVTRLTRDPARDVEPAWWGPH